MSKIIVRPHLTKTDAELIKMLAEFNTDVESVEIEKQDNGKFRVTITYKN